MAACCTRGLPPKIPPSAEHGSLDAIDAATTEWTPLRASAVASDEASTPGASSCRQSALPGDGARRPPAHQSPQTPHPHLSRAKRNPLLYAANPCPVYGVAAPIASAAQAPNKVQASMASALSGLRQRCRDNDDAGLRQASMTRLQSGKTRWRRPRNLAARRLSRRDRNRIIAHWTTHRGVVYA